jgi:hypothetical protein
MALKKHNGQIKYFTVSKIMEELSDIAQISYPLSETEAKSKKEARLKQDAQLKKEPVKFLQRAPIPEKETVPERVALPEIDKEQYAKLKKTTIEIFELFGLSLAPR